MPSKYGRKISFKCFMVKRNDSQLHKRMETNHSDHLELLIYCSQVGNFMKFLNTIWMIDE